jgi:coatomer subunit beta
MLGAQVCRTRPLERGKYIKIILALLGSTKPAVVFDCATTLTALSQAPTAVRAAANCFCQLLVSHSDNNVKLIVLDRLRALMDRHADVLSDMLMDVLRALAAPAFEIRRKVLDLAMDLITPKNISEVRRLQPQRHAGRALRLVEETSTAHLDDAPRSAARVQC